MNCQCFGESGLQATTHAGANGERCCDLCGWPVASDTPPALNAITARVLSYRPKDKGLAAKKTERRLKRQAKKEAHDDRESSI
jgi:hypothetical protein